MRLFRYLIPVLVPVLAVLALPASRARAAEPVVRVAVAHEGELLGSETKMLASLEKKLAARKLGTVRRSDASAAEAAALASDPAALPDEWRDAELVLVLQIQPAEGKKPKRISKGTGAIAIFHPPSTVAVWRESIEGVIDAGMPEPLETWLVSALALARGAK